MINKSYKHWMIVFFMCCLAASSIGLCTNAIGVFYTPVAKSLKVLKGTYDACHTFNFSDSINFIKDIKSD